MPEITFLPGRHIVRKEALPYLEALFDVLAKNQSIRIKIAGHICCSLTPNDGIDADTHTPDLSRNRAIYVYTFLLKKGISPSRMEYVGLGPSAPKISPETNEDDRIANRRVEIILVND